MYKNDGENRKSRKEGIGKLWREYIFGENEGIENDGEKTNRERSERAVKGKRGTQIVRGWRK